MPILSCFCIWPTQIRWNLCRVTSKILLNPQSGFWSITFPLKQLRHRYFMTLGLFWLLTIDWVVCWKRSLGFSSKDWFISGFSCQDGSCSRYEAGMNEICGMWVHVGWKRTSGTDITRGFFKMMQCGQPRNLTGINKRICLQSNRPVWAMETLLIALQSKKTPWVKDFHSLMTERNTKNILFSY